jgi:hypothetical protein
MAEPHDLLKARRESAALLNLGDVERLSPADALRCDLISTLRLAIDGEQATVLDGGSADLAKLITATENLIRLLPGCELPEPESSREDPRQVMWEIYSRMRKNGELNLREETQVEALQAENAQLRAALASKPLPHHVATFDPSEADITPPGEFGVCLAGPQRGPDDPPPRSTTVIEGKANPPAALAAPKYDYDKEQGWRDFVHPDGSISPTPFGSGRKFWGPV